MLGLTLNSPDLVVVSNLKGLQSNIQCTENMLQVIGKKGQDIEFFNISGVRTSTFAAVEGINSFPLEEANMHLVKVGKERVLVLL